MVLPWLPSQPSQPSPWWAAIVMTTVRTGGSSSSNGDSNLSGTIGQLTAEGSSAQQKAMSVFSAKYSQAVPGAQFSYNSTGSGAGQKQFIAGQVNFGGSDSPLDDSQMAEAKDKNCKSDVWQLPMVIGPVAVAYKLDGVDRVALSPEVIAKIFKGEIKKWNDDAIKNSMMELIFPIKTSRLSIVQMNREPQIISKSS